jgi:ABC-type dipeptide/oligopeptide/nickel transport system permease subunit
MNREKAHSLWDRARRQLLKKKFALFCFGIVGVYLLVAILGWLNVLPDYQTRVVASETYEPPALSFKLLFGTDIFGRSVVYKILAGTRTALTIGLLVACLAVPIGVTMGALSGYYGGRVDAFIVWLYTVIVSVPYILMVIAISYVLGKGMLSICIAMGSLMWVGLCRLIRAEFIKHKDREYVLASRLLGASDFVIIFKHILPNVIHIAIISGSLMVLSAIKSEVILTFLGVGITDGASWGTMISDAKEELVQGIWWPLTGVVLTMFFIIYALNVVGDALRDALDPKLLD